jgi:hypothetical protein
MNPVVKAQLKAFERANPGSGLNDSSLFEVFSIFAVCNGILTDNVNPFLVHLSGDEFGLDGVAVMIQGELCRNSDDVATALSVGKNHEVEFRLFQSKGSEKTEYGDIAKFFDSAYSFFTNSFVDPSVQLSDLIAAKDKVYESALRRNPMLRLWYVTTGSSDASKVVKQLIDTNVSRFRDLNLFDEVDISVIGAKELQEGFRSATNSISGTIEIKNAITLPPHSAVQEAFLGFVDASDLVKLATVPNSDGQSRRVNRAVFFDNVRDFDPKSEINASILQELKSGDQASFIFKNNGVTVVAQEISRKSDSFRLEDFQIVNGCQTTNILYAAGEKASKVQVPFRLIGSNNPEFVSSIILGTNKQNEVKDDQFWALKPFMKNLEEYCREQDERHRIFIERRENQYRNEQVERTRICKPRDLVKSVAAMYLFQPHRAARDYRGVILEFDKKIFQENHSVVPYHAAALSSYWVDYLIRNRKAPNEWGIFKYYFLMYLGFLATSQTNVFAMKKSQIDECCKKVVSVVSDQENVTNHFKQVATILNRMISKNALKDREKIRDYIRTESAVKEFERQIARKSL